MTATGKLYFGVVLTEGGSSISVGNMTASAPLATKSLTGTPRFNRRLSIPAGGKVVVWDFSDSQDEVKFGLLGARIVSSSGYCRVGLFIDSPTDAANDDYSASGSHDHWMHRDLSCFAPLLIDSDDVLTHATAANVTADSSGLPALWSDENRVDGRIYKLALWNTGTAAITVEVWGIEA